MKSPLGKCCQASCDEKRSPVSEGMCGLCVRKKKKRHFLEMVSCWNLKSVLEWTLAFYSKKMLLMFSFANLLNHLIADSLITGYLCY